MSTLLKNVQLIENMSLGQLGDLYKMGDNIRDAVSSLEAELDHLLNYIEDYVDVQDDPLSEKTIENHRKAIKRIRKYIDMLDKFSQSLDGTMGKVEEHIATINEELEDSDNQ